MANTPTVCKVVQPKGKKIKGRILTNKEVSEIWKEKGILVWSNRPAILPLLDGGKFH